MQGGIHALFSHGNVIKSAVLRHMRVVPSAMRSLHESAPAARMEEHGFESTTISDILSAKGKNGRWILALVHHPGHCLRCCQVGNASALSSSSLIFSVGTGIIIYAQGCPYFVSLKMTQHNVGALVVVKPGEQKSIAGIITERDYLRKIIVQGRSSKSTKVGDIMTEENKLITVSPDTKVLKAMELMTDNRIRHIPVISEGGMIGMVSIGDVVRAVVSEHRDELNRLNAFIQGGY